MSTTNDTLPGFETPVETFIQPKITGYRQLTAHEAGLMNEAKGLGAQFEDLFRRLREYHHAQLIAACRAGAAEAERFGQAEPEDWLELGRRDVQVGVMKIVRSIAQPAS